MLENIDVRHSGPTLLVNGTPKLHVSLAGKTYIQGHIYLNNKDAKIVMADIYRTLNEAVWRIAQGNISPSPYRSTSNTRLRLLYRSRMSGLKVRIAKSRSNIAK